MAEALTTREIIPQHLAIKAMRDSGYKSTAHAVAEIIDNSIQANAKIIEVFIVEAKTLVNSNSVYRVKEIAIADNGDGMDIPTLEKALQFGNGTHLNDRKGIGRFGMGIPNSTISQCRRVDIWSWEAQSENAIHSALDVNQIEAGHLKEVPLPTPKPLPEIWKSLSFTAGSSESGTVLVWSELDRVNWKGSTATLEHVESLIGRMYRKFISKGLIIRLVVVRDGKITQELNARANDPLYLTSPSHTPAPFNEKPMFQPFGGSGLEKHEILFNGEKHEVTLRFSIARDEARIIDSGKNPGQEPYGKHARKNTGVSVVRADRELELDFSWSSNDLRERWWGVELDFPPALDEVFGVTNTKQSATHFTQMAAFFLDDNRVDDWDSVRAEWEEDGDVRRYLIDICNRISDNIQLMRVQLRQQTAGARSKERKRHVDATADKATEKFKERQADGHAAEQDKSLLDKQKVEEDLVDKGITRQHAREIADAIEEHGRQVIFVTKHNPESTTFFHPEFLPGVTEIVFNTAHPAYNQLVEMLDPDLLVDDIPSLKKRIYSASDTFKMLLCAWARFEMEEQQGPRREKLADLRREWGKMAKQFLQGSEIEPLDDEEMP